MNFNSLQIFHIYYDTSTYDKVEKDVKVTMEGMLGVVGGTMGLLTGKRSIYERCFQNSRIIMI